MGDTRAKHQRQIALLARRDGRLALADKRVRFVDVLLQDGGGGAMLVGVGGVELGQLRERGERRGEQ